MVDLRYIRPDKPLHGRYFGTRSLYMLASASVVFVIRYISVSISIPLLAMHFNSVSITVLACISVSITVIVNGFDLFQLTDISVSVSVN